MHLAAEPHGLGTAPEQYSLTLSLAPSAASRRAGDGRVTAVVTETRSASTHDLKISADVAWTQGSGGSMEAGFNGLSPDDQTEAGLRAGLLGEPLPS